MTDSTHFDGKNAHPIVIFAGAPLLTLSTLPPVFMGRCWVARAVIREHCRVGQLSRCNRASPGYLRRRAYPIACIVCHLDCSLQPCRKRLVQMTGFGGVYIPIARVSVSSMASAVDPAGHRGQSFQVAPCCNCRRLVFSGCGRFLPRMLCQCAP